jgi:hypothetical protein
LSVIYRNYLEPEIMRLEIFRNSNHDKLIFELKKSKEQTTDAIYQSLFNFNTSQEEESMVYCFNFLLILILTSGNKQSRIIYVN